MTYIEDRLKGYVDFAEAHPGFQFVIEILSVKEAYAIMMVIGEDNPSKVLQEIYKQAQDYIWREEIL